MKEKYIEERHPRWFTMSTDKRDVEAPDYTVGTAATEVDCGLFITHHNALVSAVVDLAQAWYESDPEGFKAHWYKT